MAQVSIVMGTYKRSHILGRTLKSILNQSFKDIEVVVVDDNHVVDQEEIEKTKKVIDDFNDSRLKYVKNNDNLGHPANFRKCFDQITGNYFMLFSDDDELLPDALLDMVDFLKKHPAASLVHGHDIFKYPDGKVYEEPFIFNESKIIEASLYLNSHLLYDGKYNWSQSAVLYKTEFMRYNEIPIWDNYMWDSIFHSYYLLHSKNIGYINKYLCVRNEEYRHTGRNSSKFNFHLFIEVSSMMLEFIKRNEAMLIVKDVNVNKIRMKIGFKLLIQFVHAKVFNHSLFALKLAIKNIFGVLLLYLIWLFSKILAIIYGKITAILNLFKKK